MVWCLGLALWLCYGIDGPDATPPSHTRLMDSAGGVTRKAAAPAASFGTGRLSPTRPSLGPGAVPGDLLRRSNSGSRADHGAPGASPGAPETGPAGPDAPRVTGLRPAQGAWQPPLDASVRRAMRSLRQDGGTGPAVATVLEGLTYECCRAGGWELQYHAATLCDMMAARLQSAQYTAPDLTRFARAFAKLSACSQQFQRYLHGAGQAVPIALGRQVPLLYNSPPPPQVLSSQSVLLSE